MPLIQYLDKKLRAKTLALIQQANVIIADYAAQGFELTLRQTYYQFVARNVLPNTEKSYKLLGDAISDGRLSGLIDWNAIVDRTRHVRENSHWSGPSEIVTACSKQFKMDKWGNQENRVIVLIEKDALVGVIEPTCRALDVPCLSCRGYTSQTEMWNMGQRLCDWLDDGKTPHVLHFGDHDPSGIDMSRDIQDRLNLFVAHEHEQDAFVFDRLALNMDQIRKYKPPPNPAKVTDSRAEGYIAKYGRESWELDALEPKVLVALVEDAILAIRDDDAWKEAEKREDRFREMLASTAAGLKRKEKKA
jgi:hypothetical protein